MLLLNLSLIAWSQKIPKVQKDGLLCPNNLKVDGQATEWDNKFQAYDTNNRIFYTIANDDKKLYLIIQSNDINVNDKILTGGVTLTLRVDKKDVTITYPTAEDAQKSLRIRSSSRMYIDLRKHPIVNKSKIDSLINIANRAIDTTFKNIRVTGIPEITDPYIPIYNEKNIVLRAKFSEDMKYTYEISLPINIIGLSDINKSNFRYNIRLDGMPMTSANGIAPPVSAAPSQEYLYMNTPTNFWGEYTLAKK